MRRTILPVMLLLGSCGDEVPEATPTGAIQGEVRDGTTRVPIANVSVSVWVGVDGLSTTSDEQGRFVLASVPAGSELLVDFEAAGFARARAAVLIDDEAGEHPQSNSIAQLSVQLFPNANQVTVRVLDGETNQGVQGISVLGIPYTYADYYEEEVPFFGDAVLLDSLSGTTDADGEVVLSGVAAWQEYILVTEASETYGSESEDYTQGFDPSRIELAVWDLDPDEPSCNGSFDYCCDAGDPCDYGSDSICDCSMCGWDASDCF